MLTAMNTSDLLGQISMKRKCFFEQFELKLVDRGIHDFLPQQAVEREDNEQL